MSYPIEILVTSPKEIKAIQSAIQPLNRIQSEFNFKVAPDRLLENAYAFKRQNYSDVDVADWLDNYRNDSGGYRPYIIMILTGTLNVNHFGGHVASHGFAFFTIDDHHQFVSDKIRYIQYYLVRYILSFLEPRIKNHDTRNCMFDRKHYKKDIQLSLKSGALCDECAARLQPHLNAEIRPAVQILLNYVSLQIPHALVLKGGGVKGLALIGALIELEKYYSFNTFAGTSAGAIASVLMAAGYRPDELKEILWNKNFKDFIEGGLLNWICNLFANGGAETGNHLTEWIEDLLIKRVEGKVSKIEMRDLQQRAIVYASRRNEGILAFDSSGTRKEEYVGFAVRCSMSIPGVFQPKKVGDENVYDGGLGNNFPLKKFISDNNSTLFIGIYLTNSSKPNTIIGELIDIVTDADERKVVEDNIDKVVIIDPSPIGTTQFALKDKHKKFLIDTGRLGALEFLLKYNSEALIDPYEVSQLKSEVEKVRRSL